MNVRRPPLPYLAVLCLALATPAPAADGLIGHWQLAGDTRDSAGGHNDGSNHGADLAGRGPQGEAGGAARFDGRDDYVAVPDSPALRLGKGDFSIAVWVHTAAELDDVLGDIASKYDPQTRTGFVFGIKHNVGATTSQANYRSVHFGIDRGKTAAEWTDHGRPGQAVLIYSMAVYRSELFAGTCVAGADQAGEVYRFAGGRQWVGCGSPDRCNSVSALAVHQGKLYAAVGKYRLRGSSLAESENPNPGGKVYRYEGNRDWVDCGKLAGVEAINGMVVYRGKLYASSMYAPAGLFRYDGGSRWTPCGSPGGKRVEALCVYNGSLFATGYDEGAVYRYDGSKWTRCGQLGDNTQTYGFAVYQGELYVGTWRSGKVYRYAGGDRWLDTGRLGNELEVMGMAVYNGKLYAGTLPLAEVYRFDGVGRWTRTGRVDFTADVRYRRAWTMAVFQGRLFVGTLPSGHVLSWQAGKSVTLDRALPAGWTHLTAVKAGGRLKIYVNGRQTGASAPFDPNDFDISNPQDLKIGFGPHDYFNGRMRDLRFYDRALTDGEIAQLRLAESAAAIDNVQLE